MADDGLFFDEPQAHQPDIVNDGKTEQPLTTKRSIDSVAESSEFDEDDEEDHPSKLQHVVVERQLRLENPEDPYWLDFYSDMKVWRAIPLIYMTTNVIHRCFSLKEKPFVMSDKSGLSIRILFNATEFLNIAKENNWATLLRKWKPTDTSKCLLSTPPMYSDHGYNWTEKLDNKGKLTVINTLNFNLAKVYKTEVSLRTKEIFETFVAHIKKLSESKAALWNSMIKSDEGSVDESKKQNTIMSPFSAPIKEGSSYLNLKLNDFKADAALGTKADPYSVQLSVYRLNRDGRTIDEKSALHVLHKQHSHDYDENKEFQARIENMRKSLSGMDLDPSLIAQMKSTIPQKEIGMPGGKFWAVKLEPQRVFYNSTAASLGCFAKGVREYPSPPEEEQKCDF